MTPKTDNIIQFIAPVPHYEAEPTYSVCYHYAGTYKDDTGESRWIDGTIALTADILTQDQYNSFKSLVASPYDIDISNLTITSLTSLGWVCDDPAIA